MFYDRLIEWSNDRLDKIKGRIISLFTKVNVNPISGPVGVKFARLEVMNTSIVKIPIDCIGILARVDVFISNEWKEALNIVNPESLKCAWARLPDNEFITIAPGDREILNLAKKKNQEVIFTFCGKNNPYVTAQYKVMIIFQNRNGNILNKFIGYITPTEMLPFPYVSDRLEISEKNPLESQ